MKRFLSLVLLLSVTASAFAVEAEINGLWYELISKAKEATVIRCLYKNLTPKYELLQGLRGIPLQS